MGRRTCKSWCHYRYITGIIYFCTKKSGLLIYGCWIVCQLLLRLQVVLFVLGIFLILKFWESLPMLPGHLFLLESDQVPRHPTQIYEALAYLLHFLVFYFFPIKVKRKKLKTAGLWDGFSF